jgi:hypothetical protein
MGLGGAVIWWKKTRGRKSSVRVSLILAINFWKRPHTGTWALPALIQWPLILAPSLNMYVDLRYSMQWILEKEHMLDFCISAFWAASLAYIMAGMFIDLRYSTMEHKCFKIPHAKFYKDTPQTVSSRRPMMWQLQLLWHAYWNALWTQKSRPPQLLKKGPVQDLPKSGLLLWPSDWHVDLGPSQPWVIQLALHMQEGMQNLPHMDCMLMWLAFNSQGKLHCNKSHHIENATQHFLHGTDRILSFTTVTCLLLF